MSDLVQRIESLRIKAAANRGGVTSITVEELTDILAALAGPTTEIELIAIEIAFKGGDVVAIWNAMAAARLKELG